MTDQQKVREAFEAYWSEHSWNVERIDNPSGYVEYKNHDLHHIWMGWQAALAHASSATTNTQESSGRLVDARDAARYRKLFDGPYPFCFEGQTYDTKRDADEAIDQAIAGRRRDGHG